MEAGREQKYTYQAGGSLPPDSPSYVTRQADLDLLKWLLAGTYCYVLNARQMGKSSLRVHTVEQLFEAGVRCVEVELLGIGSQQITASQWYGGIIQVLISSLGLTVNRRQWLAQHEDLSPVQRLGTFIEEIVLAKTEQPLVIFFDEIDSVLGLNFPTDEFFGLVRNWYEKRATDSAYNRLTVVMLGVATPSELTQGAHSTPFNIGQAIELKGFSFEEARPLAAGLSTTMSDPEGALKEVLTWTGGQPFLTQKLCWLVTQEWQQGDTIGEFVRTRVIENWEIQDEPEHLRTIRNRVLRNARHPQRLLKLYQKILKRGAIPVDSSPEKVELRLTGLVSQYQGELRSFSQIYRLVFDRSWVAAQLKRLADPSNNSLSLRTALSVGVGTAILVVLVRSLGMLQPLELIAFDLLMRSRPVEPADDRFLLVTVSEADIQYQDRSGMKRTGSLSEEALLKLWQKLAPYEPRIVGLDVYYPFPFSPVLSEQLTQSDRFIAVCEIGQTLDTQEVISIPPPPNLLEEQVGFTDFAVDEDYRVRRHLLGMPRTEACNTGSAFSWLLALRYLAPEGKTFDSLSPDLVSLGGIELTPITPTAGGYHLAADNASGYQILVNYRNRNPRQAALKDVLEGSLDDHLEDWVRDAIVLIGIAEPKDTHFTPVRSSVKGDGKASLFQNRMLGVTIHAQMSSQLISAVLNGRPLLRWLPDWQENVWIVSWALLGSGVVWLWQRSFNRNRLSGVVLLGGNVFTLTGTAYWMLLAGVWLPLVPPLLALALSSGSTLFLLSHPPRRSLRDASRRPQT